MGKREAKKAATRHAIALATQQLVLANGYDATTVDEIARQAGTSRATFFRYFIGKEAAFFADQQEHIALFRQLLGSPDTAELPLATVRRACLQIAQRYTDERPARLAMHHEIARTPSLSSYDAQLDAEWEAAIATALGEQFAGPEARIAAGAIIGVMRAVVRHWFETGATADLVEIGEHAFEFLADGLAVFAAPNAISSDSSSISSS